MSGSPASASLRTPPTRSLLPLVLRVDAVISGATGVAYLALARPLGDLFGLPPGFLRGIGAFLALFGIVVWLVALRPRPWAAGVVAANLPWVVASFALVLFELHEPTAAGAVWTALQAIVVTLFAALTIIGLSQGDDRP